MEIDSTPPPLANVGLHTNRRVIATRNRRSLQDPKKLLSCSSDDELFVSRPQFKKPKLAHDQEINQEEDENLLTEDQEGDENLVTDDQEEPIEPMDPRLVNFMMGSSSIKWLNHEFGNFGVDDKTYSMGKYLDEYCPKLKTRLLPRRGWQVLRRTLGRARRFSQTFIEVELKETRLSPLCEPLGQQFEDFPPLEKELLPLYEALCQAPKDSHSEEFAYSNKLLESIMLVKKLLTMKKEALLEIALKNEEIEANQGSKTWRSSQHRETKALYRRCFATLYSVNDDIVAPMTVLHEYLVQYRREVEEKEARACTPLEVYRKCFQKADVDLHLAERFKSLQLYTPENRDVILKLQTILYIFGELGGPNSSDLLPVLDCLFFQLSQSLPPPLKVQLKETMDELEPYRQRLKDIFKIAPLQEPIEDIQ